MSTILLLPPPPGFSDLPTALELTLLPHYLALKIPMNEETDFGGIISHQTRHFQNTPLCNVVCKR